MSPTTHDVLTTARPRSSSCELIGLPQYAGAMPALRLCGLSRFRSCCVAVRWTGFLAFAITSCNDNTASQPGPRPPLGGRIWTASTSLRASSHEVTEFEFHMSPAASSSRPHTGGRHRWHKIKDPSCPGEVIGHPHRARDRFVRVGHHAFSPAADLVAEEAKPPCPSRSNGALGDDASLFTVEVGNGRHLDHEAASGTKTSRAE